MIEKKTVLIVGAGASKPYGYPTGLELRDELYQFKSVRDLYESYGVSERSLNNFCNYFKESQINSIDSFLARRWNQTLNDSQWKTSDTFEKIGKLAIALRIIQIELHLSSGVTLAPKSDSDNWLQYLWNMMIDVGIDEFPNNQLKIITFNYDRVLEQYFHVVLTNTYGIEFNKALELRKSIEIVHVYGMLESLEDRYYGQKPEDIFKTADCIKVIPEARENEEKRFDKAKEMIAWAERVCFVGFGFDNLNVRRLGLVNDTLKGKDVYFTQVGLTESETTYYANLIRCNAMHINTKGTLEYFRKAGVFLW